MIMDKEIDCFPEGNINSQTIVKSLVFIESDIFVNVNVRTLWDIPGCLRVDNEKRMQFK